ncbi:transposase (plasmid) [Roseomonas mucosa]|nr:transposase [Roseomonas mucosa]
MAAAKAFFRSAKSFTGIVPNRVTTDGQGRYPRVIRSTLGKWVSHRTCVFKNNGLEQDHRGIKGRIRSMRGFKSFTSAGRFCRAYDELRNHLLRIPTKSAGDSGFFRAFGAAVRLRFAGRLQRSAIGQAPRITAPRSNQMAAASTRRPAQVTITETPGRDVSITLQISASNASPSDARATWEASQARLGPDRLQPTRRSSGGRL